MVVVLLLLMAVVLMVPDKLTLIGFYVDNLPFIRAVCYCGGFVYGSGSGAAAGGGDLGQIVGT